MIIKDKPICQKPKSRPLYEFISGDVIWNKDYGTCIKTSITVGALATTVEQRSVVNLGDGRFSYVNYDVEFVDCEGLCEFSWDRKSITGQ